MMTILKYNSKNKKKTTLNYLIEVHMKIFIVRDMQWHKFKNNFYSTLLTQLNCITFVTKKREKQRQNEHKRRMKEKEGKKRFKFLWSIQFVILWCRAHFLVRFFSFCNLLCRSFLIFCICTSLFHSRPLDLYMLWHNLNWQENLANFSAAASFSSLFNHNTSTID